MKRSLLISLAVLALVALLTAVKLTYSPIGQQAPFLLYFAVVLFAAWYGGRWVSVFAVVVSALVANWFFLGGAPGLSVDRVSLVQTSVFLLEGAAMLVLMDALHLTRARILAVRGRVQALQRLTISLAGARTPEEVGDSVVREGVAAIGGAIGGATAAMFGRGEDPAELVFLGGDDGDSSLRAVAQRAFQEGSASTQGRYAGVVLQADERILGAIAVGVTREGEVDGPSRDLLATLAELASQALARAESFEREIQLRNKLETLSAAAEDFSRSGTRAEVATVVVERGMAATHADTCTLYVVDEVGDALVLETARGVTETVLARIGTITRASNPQLWTTFDSRTSLWVETAREYADAIPAVATIEAEGPRARAFWSVPLVAEGRAIGLLGMGYYEPRRFSTENRAFVEAFTRQCAQALQRALRLDREMTARRSAEEARVELEQDQRRQALVAEIAEKLAASLDYKTTLTELGSLLVPTVADWCAIEMVDEITGRSEQLAVAHSDPKMVDYAWELRRRYPPKSDAPTGVPNVLRTGVAEMYPEITDEMLVLGAIDDEHLRISRQLNLRSALVVPLVARGVTLGAITLVFAESGRRYGPDDRKLIEDIARRAAIGVDNARLFGAERRARGVADEANRLKDEFLATVSHELRTPLNAILGWSRMIRSGALAAPKQARALETIERNSVAMAQLIDDLLDVSRIISGKMRLEIETVDLTRVVEAAIESIRPAAEAKEIRLRHVLEPIHGPVMGDPNRLQQVVWNLLSNAVKFTPKGGRVEIVVRRDGSSIELCVRDDGAGIEASFLPFVFERFRQADGKITRAHGGLGLGLAITRQLVEMHGGSVQVTSEGLGHGAQFTVSLPISATRPASHAVLTAPPHAVTGPSPLQGVLVLAVDDDEDSRRLVAEILERAGAHVTLASSVDQAMEAIARQRPDVIVSDIGMPGHDGMELMRRVRALSTSSTTAASSASSASSASLSTSSRSSGSSGSFSLRGVVIPAVALTAYTRAVDRTHVLDAGFLMHVAKPVEPAELLAVVSNLARLSSR